MKQTTIFLGLFLLLGLGACSPKLTPFTENLYNEGNWTESQLEKIQFYLSEDIVLTRQLSGASSEIVSGEIKFVEGRRVEEIVIPKGTPGILVDQPRENRFAVSFESGNDRFLMFGPNSKAGGKYVLLASEWKRRTGVVTYDGRKYRVGNKSAFASLMVDLEKIRNVNVNSRTAKGRLVK